MKPRLFAILSATLLSGCVGLNVSRACDTALLAARTAPEAIAILQQQFGLSEEKARQWAAGIAKGRGWVARFCSAAAPVAVVGM